MNNALRIIPVILGLAVSACSSGEECDSPEVVRTVDLIILDKPTESTPPALIKQIADIVSVDVTDQRSDESGRHITCTAQVSVDPAKLSDAEKLMSEHDARTSRFMSNMEELQGATPEVHYTISINRDDEAHYTVYLTGNNAGLNNVAARVRRVLAPASWNSSR